MKKLLRFSKLSMLNYLQTIFEIEPHELRGQLVDIVRGSALEREAFDFSQRQFTKKLICILLSISLLFMFGACSTTNPDVKEETSFGYIDQKPLADCGVVSEEAQEIVGDPSRVKIGVILVGDENEGYTWAHMDGIQKAATALRINSNQILYKYSVGESQDCYDAATDLVNQGCDLIVANSYGHQPFIQHAAEENPNVHFISMTGDTAASSELDNFSNAFTAVYESRYVSGVVAGMKLKELVATEVLTKEKVPNSFDEDGNIKIGYVGAYPYAEVVSGYTAFYLGVKSIVPNVVMEVTYTNSWFDITAEGTAAEKLIANGCVIIGQHADSTGAPAAVQAKHDAGAIAYSVGYNVSMNEVAPDASLTSASNNWEVYYKYAFAKLINGEKIATNWCAGYNYNAVCVTTLGRSCADYTEECIANVINQIKNGELHVFDTNTFTVDGKNLTWAYGTDSDGDFAYDCNNVISDGYYHESYIQSAPAFTLRIDGITED